ncbi:Ni/Fe-hydrogenase, b-type cytochrome subunit [uncultured Thiothrix sp.]|uniref:Ni/Fe-hydrogenase, b-type cytochrome subunit n=1 Tax=uncultured Thiothrix sp. TaxID=223185 RepID=UPI002632FE38|nr:Ni/Fe-hydrogenase, b-type cytochrome subunit [uncultured Thiothrix sp.]HMT93964.1 Ni/Fe-hydrogenase, b-type cytochrome subunit [Thiolinea sp.]
MSQPNDTPAFQPAVYVYEAPLRIWHWINALAIVILAVTGYFIGSPLPTMSGEASDHFLMGYIRFAHFAAGYILLIGFLGRVYWAFVGNHHAREIFIPPFHKPEYWSGVLHEIRWYAFLEKEPRKYTGHNPLAILFMHFMFVWGLLFMIVTGFALYGEGAGLNSWQFALFSSWVIPLFGQSMDVHTWHHLGMWWILLFVMAHIYVAIREDIMSRQSLVSTMISGWRTFKDQRKVDDGH